MDRNSVSSKMKSCKEFKTLFDALTTEYLNVQWHWQELNELYIKHDVRVGMMNEVAPDFFGMVQRLMLEHLVLGLCRLTDKPKSAGQDNLTIKRIPDYLTDELSQHAEQLTQLVNNAQTIVDNNLRKWRHDHIAHSDFKRAVSEDRNMYTTTIAELRSAISAIHAVLNETSVRVWNCELSPTVEPSFNAGDSRAIVAALEKLCPSWGTSA